MAFLGVSRSLTGRRWRERAADAGVARDHQARLGLSPALARALAARSVAAGEGETYLRPTLKALFPDPSSFKGMDDAVGLILAAVEAGGPITIFADYDVDGASSAAQLARWLRHMGAEPSIYVPDRIAEGYGPSPAAFRKIKDGGAALVVTVDCGAAAYDAVAAADEMDLTVVVIDHHLMRDAPIRPAALVNPNQPGCESGQGVLAAAGVTFVLLAALNREARRRGLFAERCEPDLRQWLDLAAMGAICDVTQLTGFNRALVAQGLKTMAAWANPGLAALMRIAGAKMENPGSFEAGFILGPRINAGGRIGRSDLGARLLSTDDPAEAGAIAAELDALNQDRKGIEREVFEAAVAAIERGNIDPAAPVIVAAGEGWRPGVIGIVASRLRERYRRPAMVIGVDTEANLARGSGRSQPGVNLGRAVQAAFDAGLLMSGGGHAMAAGLTARPSAIPELRAFLCERLAAETALARDEDAVDIDALISPGASAKALLGEFAALEPFGPGAPEPVFALADARVERPMALRGGHVRCDLVDGAGGRIKAVAWRAGETELGRRLLAGGGSIHVAGRLKANDWNGKTSAEIHIEDVADPRRLAPAD